MIMPQYTANENVPFMVESNLSISIRLEGPTYQKGDFISGRTA